MNASFRYRRRGCSGLSIRSSFLRLSRLAWLGLGVLLGGASVRAQSSQPASEVKPDGSAPHAPRMAAASREASADSGVACSISGTVVDPTGAQIAGAHVGLAGDDRARAAVQESLSDDDGRFAFANVAPGPFRLTVAFKGFATQEVSGTLQAGEARVLPQIALAVAAELTEVSVVLSRVDIAQAEIKEEEKQRVLGFIPNFYVSYSPHAAPLVPRQKFELAFRTVVDPITFGMTAIVAGVRQSRNDFSDFGQGAQGYGKRFGAAYADMFTDTVLGGAVFPSLLKQDPRYFYKGTGSIRSRFMYALASAVMCKSDRGRWQPNYSGIMGSIASGGISNLYYPSKDRGAGLVFQGALVDIGTNAAANVFQEFVVRRLTPGLSQRASAKP